MFYTVRYLAVKHPRSNKIQFPGTSIRKETSRVTEVKLPTVSTLVDRDAEFVFLLQTTSVIGRNSYFLVKCEI